ncbi:MAG: tRNA (cytidine(34)-2'-O)-methyltransferase, partial [Verrucomicrobia bacterium]|nr:tRNA (cytidine(34)-2'-O)-methyltransferase [Verrucomicrobiota bacterium]
TGNVVRTCSVTGAGLILVHPLGFSTHSRHLKRAGLDYWEGVDVLEIEDLDAYLATTDAPFFFFSSKASVPYTGAPYAPDSLLIFGSETSGLPAKYLEKWPHRFFTIPMRPGSRCLNLATSVGIVLFEAIRQTHFLEKSDNTIERAALTRTEEVTGR